MGSSSSVTLERSSISNTQRTHAPLSFQEIENRPHRLAYQPDHLQDPAVTFSAERQRPLLPPPEVEISTSQTAKPSLQTTSLQPSLHIDTSPILDQLNKTENRAPTQTPSSTSQTTSLPRELTYSTLLVNILEDLAALQTSRTKDVLRERQKLSQALTEAEKKHNASTKAIQEKQQSAENSHFWIDLFQAISSSTQIVIGGACIASGISGMNKIGYSLVASGCAGIAAQTLKALGYHSIMTGAVSMLSSAVGLLLGTSAGAIALGQERSKLLMSTVSLFSTLLNTGFSLKEASAKKDIAKLQSEQVEFDNKQETLSDKMTSLIRSIKTTYAKMDQEVTQAFTDYAERRSDVLRRIQSAGSAA